MKLRFNCCAPAGGAAPDAFLLQPPHTSRVVDATEMAAVRASAVGTDCIVNLAVVRPHRQLAFDVNCRGTYNAISSAAALGHARFINTGAPRRQRPAYSSRDLSVLQA